MPNPRPDLNGLRVQLPGQPHIYLVDGGCKRHIPDPATYDNLFRNWDSIYVDINVDDISNAQSIPSGAVMAQGKGRAEVYFIDGGVKRHILSPAVMDRYNFRWPTTRIDTSIIDAIPNGSPIG